MEYGAPFCIAIVLGFLPCFVSDIELMHSWGFALREGVFAETKEGKFKNKREKS